MKIQRNYNKSDILTNSNIGFEFEFYSSIHIKEVAKSLSKKLGVRVVVPLDIPPVGLSSKPIYHSGIVPDEFIFKIEADYSGGKDMKELITGPLKYKRAIEVLYLVLEWIKEFGYTNEKCSIHANISFSKDFKINNDISKLDVMKFIMNFDEDFVYKRFPTRINSVYARSINHIIPNNIFFYNTIPIDGSTYNMFSLPQEKYFGVNFTKVNKNYLEFRYMGGKDYEKRYIKVLECVDHYILSLYKSLNFNEYSWKDNKKIKERIDKQKDLVSIFNNYELFKQKFPKFNITVNMNNDTQNIKSYWENIKNDIFSLIIRNNISVANYNYDKDRTSKQLFETDLKNALLKGYDLIYCEIEGILHDCDLYHCNISHSRLSNCDAVRDNKFQSSKLENVNLPVSNETQDSFIKNDNKHIINCKVNGGVIRAGEVGDTGEIGDDVLVVEDDPKVTFKTNDWEWIKTHRKFNRNITYKKM